jgi:hypothetical protein
LFSDARKRNVAQPSDANVSWSGTGIRSRASNWSDASSSTRGPYGPGRQPPIANSARTCSCRGILLHLAGLAFLPEVRRRPGRRQENPCVAPVYEKGNLHELLHDGADPDPHLRGLPPLLGCRIDKVLFARMGRVILGRFAIEVGLHGEDRRQCEDVACESGRDLQGEEYDHGRRDLEDGLHPVPYLLAAWSVLLLEPVGATDRTMDACSRTTCMTKNASVVSHPKLGTYKNLPRAAVTAYSPPTP